MKHIEGGICAAKGFKAAGIHCGIREGRTKRDFALIVSEKRASAAGVFTQNLVKGAPVVQSIRNLKDGHASAVICNSGNANTCNANGMEIALGMCELVHDHLQIDPEDVIVASTGVIGQEMSLTPMAAGMKELVGALADTPQASKDAAEAIMTTDTKLKEIAVEFEIGGKTCRMGAISKGSGMIHPNMATMLCFMTCDVAITPELLQKALSENVKDTYNMVSVDRDTSTNDTLTIMCNGLAGNEEITEEGAMFDEFKKALFECTSYLARATAADGEGATKLIECNVTGAKDKATAKILAKSVICSPLVKAMIFGRDANCGRVMCALGYAGVPFEVEDTSVTLRSRVGSVLVCHNGNGLAFDEDKALMVLGDDEIDIDISVGNGDGFATAWGCDLTYDYVKINGDYRT
ncbi:MAG: bifunctional ornithine acetyltransferase/N-acetylglutamate synthase [Lachnospiraceae bacterium]|nr:bifunctional ornithine acetyltransferase/N-acetylglutamate synthase [Lachnospiraceae bacterium]